MCEGSNHFETGDGVMIQNQAGAGLAPLGTFRDIMLCWSKCPRMPDQHPMVSVGYQLPKTTKKFLTHSHVFVMTLLKDVEQ